jgi:methylglutaconyl-CoA hydratase
MAGSGQYQTIKIQQDGQIVTLWLNRPEKRNSLSGKMLSDIHDFLESHYNNKDIRVLVIRGSGKYFCSGADLNEMKPGNKSKGSLVREAELFYDVFNSVFRFPVPTVCIAHGGVFGGGNGLVASSDISLSTPGCKFAFSEVRLGLVPATISPFVIRRIGEYNARRLFSTGEVFDASFASSINLVNEVVGKSGMENRIKELTGYILQAGPEAVKRTKNLIFNVLGMEINDQLKSIVTGEIAETRLSDEAIKGISAFFKGEKPDWK